MNTAVAPAAKDAGFFRRAVQCYENQTGQPALAWLLVALANFAFQGLLYYEMHSAREETQGEFGTLNAAVGIIGLWTVPLLAVHHALHFYSMRPQATGADALDETLRSSSVTVIETTAWIWGGFCCLLTLISLPLPSLPRSSLQLFALVNVLVALGSVLGQTVCENENRHRFWISLFVAAAFARVVVASIFTAFEPWAEAGLTVSLVAGFITLAPAFRSRSVDWLARINACRAIYDRDFLLFAGAALSIFTGLYLFTNADRIVSLTWVDAVPKASVMMGADITKSDFDTYQATGLLGRALLWGTQPLLWILYAQRARLARTTIPSLVFFWIYLGALIAGAFLLGSLTQTWGPISVLIQSAPKFGPTFAAVMIPLGLLQGLGIFSLASRRYPECFVLGGCSVIYTFVLILMGRHPEFMLPYMFGASIISIMAVLFVGIVRWGRKQP